MIKAKPEKQMRIKINFKQAMQMIYPYAKTRIKEQIKSVSLIVIYLILFQTAVLRIPLAKAAAVGLGIFLVIFGLAFFMDGLNLGLMPLGEACGIKLPKKTKIPGILLFAFILGVGATFAEPAIGVLKAAGVSVKAWEAPLLFRLLNKDSGYLVAAVGAGVGIAVMFGMLRFIYKWSLKPFIYVLIPIMLAISALGLFNCNIRYLTGLAWDCGGVTTGPVTVPLVLALGIGISRMISNDGSGTGGGFGVVTLASAFPVITVFILGIFMLGSTPEPMSQGDFVKAENRSIVSALFESDEELSVYVAKNLSRKDALIFFNDSGLTYLEYKDKSSDGKTGEKDFQFSQIFKKNLFAAGQAIFPLCFFLLFVLAVLLREKIPKYDEVLLGIVFAVAGMTFFNIGIELGLSRIGNQVGESLPSSFKAIALPDKKQVISSFDTDIVNHAVSSDGTSQNFFYIYDGHKYKPLPFDESAYNSVTGEYTYIPTSGPLFGKEGSLIGILVVLLFAFIMGYGATLAEPALNALGATVENITVGTFKKSLLIHSVAVGVGIGMFFGVAKIIWDFPLIYLIGCPYILLIFLTAVSSEDYVNVGWDSAGVTTGPITVPLVLAMGLGIGGQVGIVEGFGILAASSVFPILSVLLVGLVVNHRRKKNLTDN